MNGSGGIVARYCSARFGCGGGQPGRQRASLPTTDAAVGCSNLATDKLDDVWRGKTECGARSGRGRSNSYMPAPCMPVKVTLGSGPLCRSSKWIESMALLNDERQPVLDDRTI